MNQITIYNASIYQNKDAALRDVVAELYQTFSRYQNIDKNAFLQSGEGYHCEFIGKKLQSISRLDFQKYLHTAVSSWGSVENFKFFLPRILELLASHNEKEIGLSESDCMIICGKLAYAKWKEWPESEQELLYKYFLALFVHNLVSPANIYAVSDNEVWRHYTYSSSILDWIFDFCIAGFDVKIFLDCWTRYPEITSVVHLAKSILCYCEVKNNRAYINPKKIMGECASVPQVEEWLCSKPVEEMISGFVDAVENESVLQLLVEADSVVPRKN